MAKVCVPAGPGFQLTDHACRYCAGRILQSGDQFRCGGCGAVTMHRATEICGCGVIKRYKAGQAVFRCGPNLAQSPGNPSQIVILFDGRQVAPALPLARAA
jgi:hypothetical protein